ncbi:MAG: hypothetical protein V1779_09795 [bacterium]
MYRNKNEVVLTLPDSYFVDGYNLGQREEAENFFLLEGSATSVFNDLLSGDSDPYGELVNQYMMLMSLFPDLDLDPACSAETMAYWVNNAESIWQSKQFEEAKVREEANREDGSVQNGITITFSKGANLPNGMTKNEAKEKIISSLGKMERCLLDAAINSGIPVNIIIASTNEILTESGKNSSDGPFAGLFSDKGDHFEIRIADKMLSDNPEEIKNAGLMSENRPFNFGEVIAHEFGHLKTRVDLGYNDYHFGLSDYQKENYAIRYQNNYLKSVGLPTRRYKWVLPFTRTFTYKFW